MALPAVTVILCTFNGAPFLTEQLNSILFQQGAVLEIIIQDDGSTDGTLPIIREYHKKHPGTIKYFVNETQRGYGDNFRDATLKATGDYLFFCDQDDSWYPGKMETFLNAWKTQPTVQGWFCNADVYDEENTPGPLSIWDITYGSANLPAEIKPEYFFPMQVLNHSFILGATMAVTRKSAQMAFSFPWLPGFPFHDYHLALHLSLMGGLRPIPQRLQSWRQHAGQQTGAAGYWAKKERIQLARIAWLQQWQPEADGLEVCRYWAFGLTQLEKQQGYWQAVSDKDFRGSLKIVATKFAEARQRYFAAIPWVQRKKILLKHFLKGGEYLRVTAGDLWNL